jgi:putative oxidoreductase
MFRSPDLAALILRLALGAIFITHGCLKVIHFNGGTEWYPDTARMPAAIQVAVAWGEVLCGVLLVCGLLTRVAALGTVVIMIGAVYYIAWKLEFAVESIDRTNAARLQVGYEYNYALIAMGVSLVILGAGAMSVDRLLFGRAPEAAAPTTPQREHAGVHA